MEDFDNILFDYTHLIKLYADKIELLHSQIDSLEADSTTLELLVNAIKSAIKKSDYSSGYDLDSKFVLDAFKVLLPDDYSDRIDELKIEEKWKILTTDYSERIDELKIEEDVDDG